MTNRRLAMIPRWIRPTAVVAARLLWCLKATWAVPIAARRFGFGAGEALRQYADAWLHGLRPRDSFSWRHSGVLPRPLSTYTLWQLQYAIDDPAQRRRMGDKLAMAAALRAVGVAVPRLLAVIPAGTAAPELPDAPNMFVKPRDGRRGRNAFSITRLAPDLYRIGGAERDAADMAARLRKAAASEDLLVQERLVAAPELADFASAEGVPPVMRMVTACEPDGQPFVQSAWLTIKVPGEASFHPLRDAIRVPVSLATGKLLAGYWLGEAGTRFDVSPWHQAKITGRTLPGFDKAIEATIIAARTLPGVPVVGWDVVLTAEGPVILEGNSNNDWLVVRWAEEGASDPVPLLPLMMRWAVAKGFITPSSAQTSAPAAP